MNPHGPRILANVDKMKAQGASDDEVRSYLMAEGFKPANSSTPDASPATDPIGPIRGATLDVAKHVPFLTKAAAALRANFFPEPEAAAAMKANPLHSTGVFKDQYGKALASAREGQESFTEQHPIANAALGIGSTFALAAGTAPLGMVKGAALLGAADAVGNSDKGLKSDALAGLEGGVGGAIVGKVGEKLFQLGGTKALTAIGAALGARSKEGGVGERAIGAMEGAGAGYGVARVGGEIASRTATKLADALGAASPILTVPEQAASKYATAFEREGLTPETLRRDGPKLFRGNTALEQGTEGGPIQRLARAVESIPSTGGKDLRSALAERSALKPPAAESAVRKALGNRFKPTMPAVQEAKQAIAEEANPLYEKLHGVEVSSGPLRQLIADEPLASDLWEHATALSKSRVRAGFRDATELPPLSTITEDGSEVPRETVPVLGIDILKRALRAKQQSMANSANPITDEYATVLGKRLGDIVSAAKDESPEYADALRGYAEISQKNVKGMARQKQGADFILGNSQTQRIAKDQEDLSTLDGFKLKAKDLAVSLLKSKFAARIRGMDEAMADELSPLLLEDWTQPGVAERAAQRIEVVHARRIGQRQTFGTLPRAAAGGVGYGIAAQNRDNKN